MLQMHSSALGPSTGATLSGFDFEVLATWPALLGAACRRSVGRHEIEQSERFSLLAELALAVGGFTGVAAGFGGRDRGFTLAERTRLLAIFVASGVVLAGSLCVLVAPTAGATAGLTYAAASLLGAAVLFPYSRVIPRAYSLAADPSATTSFSVLGVAVSQLVVCVGLMGDNLVRWSEAWPLLVAFSIQLLWGLYLFVRILGQRN